MRKMKHSKFDFKIVATILFAMAVAACSGTSSSPGSSTTSTANGATPSQTADAQSATIAPEVNRLRWNGVAFAAASFAGQQTAGSISLTVIRQGMPNQAVTVNYSTTDGTAIAGVDYTKTTGTLSWAENDYTEKTLYIPISKAKLFSNTKAFEVVLTDPTQWQLEYPSTANVVISGDAVAQLGTLQLDDASYSVPQNAGTKTISVNRMDGSSGAVSVAYATVNGTAVTGKDFTAASGTLDWNDGETTAKTFTVAISNSTPFAGSKAFSVALSKPGSGATLGTPGSAPVTINGDATPAVGNVHLAASSNTVTQNAGTATMSVSRSGGSNGAVSVAYATANGTAVAGADYSPVSGTLQWANGDASAKAVAVPIMNTAPFTGNKVFSLALSKPSAGASIASPATASVTIEGDASAPVGNVQLSASTYSVSQAAGTLTVTVDRAGGSNGAVSATYSAVNGTALAGTDFTAPTGAVNWAAGDTSPKTFSVALSNKTPFAGTRSFTLKLSNAGGGATLSTPSSAIVNITGDASAAVGALQLSAASNSVAQSAGTLTLTVNRTGGSSGAASVQYATAGGTAVSGTNFTATSGTLNWASGDEASKTFTVPISNATPFTGTKSFTLALSSASGATLGSPTSDTVTITGSGVAGNGGDAPSAPNSLVMTNQSQNSISLSWSAAAPGAAPISHYKIYRNGAAYATATATTYTDSGATNANSPLNNAGPILTVGNTIYAYAVSAVDTAGNEGPQQADATFWVYYNGVYNWLGDYSYPTPGGISINYADTSGAPEEGPADIEVNSFTTAAGFLPYSGKTTTQWDMEGGSFNYISMDLKPTLAGQDWQMYLVSRLSPGDVTPWAFATLSHYGPAPVVGKWATYKIPLSDFAIGISHFTASISGTTLNVTAVESGVGLEAGGYITGAGIPTGTYIIGNSSTNGGPGNYQVQGPGISGSTSVASESMVEQHTGIYKFGLVDRNASSPGNNHYYIDNIKFTVD
jgi:Calx-beta domain